MSPETLTLQSDSLNPQQTIDDTTSSSVNSLRLQQYLDWYITNTMPPFASQAFIERLYEEQERLINKRNDLLDHASIALNSAQQNQLDAIDARLDDIESYIEGLRKQTLKIEVKSIERVVDEDDLWIKEMAKKIRG